MASKVAQALVLGLGEAGKSVLACMEELLRERHPAIEKYGPGIPTVKLIHMTPSGGEEVQSSPGEAEKVITERLELPLDLGTVGDLQQFAPWLPPGITLEEVGEVRAGGRLALFCNGERVVDCMEDALHDIMDVGHAPEMERKALRVDNPQETDIYVVASSSEPFASGLFLDLSYLIAHLTSSMAALGLFHTVSGILLLPGGNKGRAESYAALKELDYYMAPHMYRLAYPQGLEVSFDGRKPLEHVYLVEQFNEVSKALSPGDRNWMVAEWLYAMLACPPVAYKVHQCLSPGYGSFGFSSLVFPVEAFIRLEARRMGAEMVGENLLRSVPPEEVEAPTIFRSDAKMTQDALEQRVGDDSKWVVKRSGFAINPHHFENVSLLRIGDFEKRLEDVFGAAEKGGLEAVRREAQLNAEGISDRFASVLHAKIVAILDERPLGGISAANQYLHRLKEDFEKSQEAIQNEIDETKKKVQAIDGEINEAEAEHRSAVSAVNWPALAWAAVVLLATLLYTEWVFLGRFYDFFPLHTLVGGLSLAVGTLVVGGLGTKLFRGWLSESKGLAIAKHNAKLRESLGLAIRENVATLLECLPEMIDKEVRHVTDFRDTLELVRVKHEAALAHQSGLYGCFRFSLEESSLAEEEANRIYLECIGESLADEIRELLLPKRHGPFSGWLGRGADEVAGWIYVYAMEKMAVVREKGVTGLIAQKYPNDEELKIKVSSFIEQSRAFWRFASGSGQMGLQSGVTIIGVEDEYEDSRVNRVVKKCPVQVVSTGDRHRVMAVSVSSGVPLAELACVRTWKRPYDDAYPQRAAQLHAEKGRVALLDLVHREELDAHTALALGIARGLVVREEDKWVLTSMDAHGEQTTIRLPGDKLEACIYLGSHPTELNLLARQLAAPGIGEEQDRITRLRNYLENNPDLEEWERLRVRERLNALRLSA